MDKVIISFYKNGKVGTYEIPGENCQMVYELLGSPDESRYLKEILYFAFRKAELEAMNS